MSRRYPPKGSVDVLFVAYGGGHIQMIVPVAKQLQDQGCRVAILALTTALSVVAGMDLDHFTFADVPRARDHDVLALGASLAAQLPAGGTLPFAETQAYLGLNYWDLTLQYGAVQASQMWQDAGRQVFYPVNLMREILADIAPKLVVATNSPRSEQAAIDAAGGLGIASVAMVDMFALQEVKWLAKPGFGSKLLVLNDSVRQMMIQNGRPAEDVIVTGNPAFDSLRDAATVAAGQRMRAARGWGRDGRRTLLYASGPEPERHPFTGAVGDPGLPLWIENHLRDIVAKDTSLELVIRRHPSEDQQVLPAERVDISPRTDDVSHVIHAVDLVIVMVSTVGLQAHLAGRCVLSIQGSVFSADAPYADYGMAIRVETYQHLASSIGRALALIAGDGPDMAAAPATQTVCQILLELLAGQQRVVRP